MDLNDLEKLFIRAKELTNHTEFVVIGSNSILGVPRDREIPPRMTMSNDVDAYTLNDPERVFALNSQLGQGSAFELKNGFYLDPVSPALPTLPQGWESRLFKVELKEGVILHFLDANDAAISKYARCEPRDREWLRAGLEAGILSPAIIEYRMRETVFEDNKERQRAVKAFQDDQVCTRHPSRRKRP